MDKTNEYLQLACERYTREGDRGIQWVWHQCMGAVDYLNFENALVLGGDPLAQQAGTPEWRFEQKVKRIVEQAFITAEQAEQTSQLIKLLRSVEATGEATCADSELLSVNDLADIGPPRDNITYNCLHLTDKGREFIQTNQ